MKVVCKEEFIYNKIRFEVGIIYESYTNFQGLNHIVIDSYNRLCVFDPYNRGLRPYIWDYFQTLSDYRDIQLDKILK